MSVSDVDAPKPSFMDIMKKSRDSALRGGLAGGAAMVCNVGALMWMRTTINFQYANGTSMTQAFKTIYSQGGIPRFYRGVAPALIQGPLSRFGDTAANTGMITMLDSFPETKNLPTFVKTVSCSIAAASFRILLMPIDTCKTTMQVQGSIKPVFAKVAKSGPQVLFHGSLAAASATFVGHYPWFFTYNFLGEKLPKQDDRWMELGRRALMGFCASAVSDTCSNSIRVVKVFKQSSKETVSYPQAARAVIAKDGIRGLMFRGLETKIFANGLQGILFSILWKQFEEMLKKD